MKNFALSSLSGDEPAEILRRGALFRRTVYRDPSDSGAEREETIRGQRQKDTGEKCWLRPGWSPEVVKRGWNLGLPLRSGERGLPTD